MDLPIDLLEDIFLRLGDAADLACASAACASFRRVIVSDGRFLRRYRSVHRRQPILGLLTCSRPHGNDSIAGGRSSFHPVQWPRRAELTGAALAGAADFAFSFLPDTTGWRVREVREGRVLLSRPRAESHGFEEDLVVCDPLHRRHLEIPPIPGDLLAAAFEEHGHGGGRQTFEAFLSPPAGAGDESNDDEAASFRVVCNVMCERRSMVGAFVFSSITGRQWSRVASFSNPNYFGGNMASTSDHLCYAFNSFYRPNSPKAMLVLDMREMKFSIVNLPIESFGFDHLKVFEIQEGRLGLLLLVADHCMLRLYSRAWEGSNNNGAATEEWRHDKTVAIMQGYSWMLAGQDKGYVLLRGIPIDQYHLLWDCNLPDEEEKKLEAHYFAMDLKTLLVERLCVLKLNFHDSRRFLYASFPPPLSLPSI